MKAIFCEISMALLIQQNESLRKEFSEFGFDSSDEAIEHMKMLINNNFLHHKAKSALNKMFKKHIEDKTGYLPSMYAGFGLKYRKHESVDGQRFYVYNIHETNGEREYTHTGVVSLNDGIDPDKWQEDYIKDFYPNFSERIDDGFWFDGGEVICELGEMKEVSKDEYDVLVKYI